MSSRLSLTLGLCLLFLTFAATVPAAHAQRGPDIFVTPIPNAPFTAIVQVERSEVHPDGTTLKMKTFRQIGRDGHGRIYNEMRILVSAETDQIPKIASIRLYDPQTRVSTTLNALDKTFWTMTVNRPPATVPPGPLDATPAGNTLQQNEFTTKEDLGVKDFGGTSAHGVRSVQKLPVEGSSPTVTVTDEYWYSDDLRINLLIKHDDPRTGSVTLTVGKIQRAEPDPAMFEVPQDYRRAENR